LIRRECLGERRDLGRFVGGAPVALPQRQDGSARARDAGGLAEVVDGSLDVVVGLEHRIGVEDELHIRVEPARLLLDRRRLADRHATLNDGELDAVKFAERSGALRRRVRAAIVDEDDSPRPKRLAHDRRETTNDVLFLVERRDDDVHGGVAPVFVRRRPSGVGTAHQTDDAEQCVRTENEMR
jgi:hypothetical protein